MNNQLKQDKDSLDYSYLIAQEPQDTTNELRQEILKAAFSKSKGKKPNGNKQWEQIVTKESDKIIEEVKKNPILQANINMIEEDVLRMEHLNEVKMVSIDLQVSGSSSEEIQPVFQMADDVVVIAAGAPVTLKFYIIGQIITSSNTTIQPTISILQSFKGAKPPTIQTQKLYGKYRIYEITISSLIRKYEIRAELNGKQLKSKQITFDDKKDSILLLDKGFQFNFIEGTVSSLGLLEQLIIYSLFQDTQSQLLERIIARVNVQEEMRLPDKLVQAVNEAENVDYMYGLLLKMIANWQIKKVLHQEKIRIYKLIAQAFLNENCVPFSSQEQFSLDERKRLVQILTDIIIENNRKNIIFKDQAMRLFDKLTRNIQNHYQDLSGLIILQKFVMSKSRVLHEKESDQFKYVKKFVIPFCKIQEDMLAADILSCCYYYNIKAQTSKLEAVSVVVNQITQKYEGIIMENSQYLNIATFYLFEILNNQDFVITNLVPDQFLKFIRVFPIIASLKATPPRISAQVDEWLKSCPKKYLRTKNYKSIVQIISELIFNYQIKRCFYPPNTQIKYFEKVLQQLLAYKIDDQDTNKKINSLLIVQSILYGQLLSQNLYERYILSLKALPRKKALDYLNYGLNDQFFENGEYQAEFDKILMHVLSHFFSKPSVLTENWNYEYIFNSHICEKLLETAIGLKKLKSSKNEITQFLQIEQSKIESHPKLTNKQKQRLKIIILSETMELSPQNIKNYLKHQQKLYLKILCNILFKNKDERKQSLLESINKICGEIQRGELSYSEIKMIIPTQDKDIERLIKLIAKERFNILIQNYEKVQARLNRFRKIDQFIDQVKQRFQVPPQQIERIKNKIRQKIQQLQRAKVKDTRSTQDMPEYQNRMLNLTKFKFLFKNIQVQTNSMSKLLQQLGEQINKSMKKLQKLVSTLNNNKQILMDQYMYFNINDLSAIQLKELLQQFYQQKLGQAAFKLVRQIQNNNVKIRLYKALFGAIHLLVSKDKDIKKEMLNQVKEICQFCQLVENPVEGTKIAIHEYTIKFQTIDKILISLGLQINEQELMTLSQAMPISQLYRNYHSIRICHRGRPSMILTLITLTDRVQSIQKLKKLKASIKTIRQGLLNSSHQNISISYRDLDLYNSMMKILEKQIFPFYGETNNTFKLVQAIFLLSQKYSQTSESFNSMLINLTNKANQLQQCYNMTTTASYYQKLNISNLINSSEVIIQINADKHTHSLKILCKSNQKSAFTTFNQLQRFKDEAYIIKNKAADLEDENQRKKLQQQMKVFISYYEHLRDIRDMQGTLLASGFMVFKNQMIKLDVQKENLGNLRNYLEKISQTYKKWSQKINLIYGYSIKATMLGGKKMQDFYNVIRGNVAEGNIQQFRYIANSAIIKEFIKKKIPLDTNLPQPFNFLELVKQFFKHLKNKTQQAVVYKAPDRQESYVQLFRFQEGQFDYVYCLNQISKEKLKNIDEGHILSCKSDTTIQDVQSFFERSLLDPDNQYIILNYNNLSQSLQNAAIQKIESFSMNNINRIKLCVAGRQTSHAIYRYLNNKIKVKTSKEGTSKMQQSAEYKQFINNKINNQKLYGFVRIYKSAHPGLGKTFQIENEVRKIGHQLIYFPISGRTNSKDLFNRLQNKIRMVEGNKKYSIVLQIYETQKQCKDIINDFVRQLVLMRSFQYMRELCVANKDCRVYVEIQDERVVKSLPIINYLSNKFKQIVVQIKKFDANNIQATTKSLKLCYILQHLQHYKNNTLDTKDISKPITYKATKQPDLTLLKQYFISKFPQHTHLTYYQLNYWIDLFYQSCCAFTCSDQISYHFLLTGYSDFVKKYKLQKLRSEFFKVLLDNSIQFLSFSIEDIFQADFNAKEGNQQEKKKNQHNLPFFIVPNNQNLWFSFIYRSTSEIPKVIRSFFVSQAALYESLKKDGRKKVSEEQFEKQVFEQKQLNKLQNFDRKKFQQKVEQILRDISGVHSYKLGNDPRYVINLDNFIKMCLISYKMKVNIPLLVQGQAGVGKTALLRYLTQQVFQYQFIPHTINAGLSEQSLLSKIEDAEKRLSQLQNQSKDLAIKKKLCILFDQFNTLPELGYIKELMMEKRFIGEQKSFFKDCIVFAACNPFRNMTTNKVQFDKLQQQKKQVQLAFSVKRPPLSMGQIMWNFGSLQPEDMNKYVTKMVDFLEQDLKDYQLSKLIAELQNYFNKPQYGYTSLRDIERFRQLYLWLKQKMPIQSKITPLPQDISQIYENKALRAFCVAINLTYFTRLNTSAKLKQAKDLIDSKSAKIKFDFLKQVLIFEQDDFSRRVNINYDGVFLNTPLKQNLYCVFICYMTKLPILIVGSPGCSKSLASRIISDNFKRNDEEKNKDKWFKTLPNIQEFFFQGSESCTTSSVEKKFEEITKFQIDLTGKKQSNEEQKLIPIFIFDEMGLAQRSEDNPLKAIHEPLELSFNTNKKKSKMNSNKGQRCMGFLGISNHELDLSKMSRFLVLRRGQLQVEDLKQTAKGISKAIFKGINFNHENIQPYLEQFSKTYFDFLQVWIQQEGRNSDVHRNFFGLRDFYSLVRTFSSLIKAQKNKNNLENIDKICDTSIYRNFNGLPHSYRRFRQKFFELIGRALPDYDHNPLQEVIQSLDNNGRRYPLLITPNSISRTFFSREIEKKFNNSVFIEGSPFLTDIKSTQYITKNITEIMKIVGSSSTLIASSLNKTVQGALFDLFNKFFINRDGQELYRIALQQSGYSTIAVAHPQFRTSIIISSQHLLKESSAFLNRFEKYEISINNIKNEEVVVNKNKLKDQFFKNIEKACQQFGCSHYKNNHLFLNISEDSVASLVYKSILQSNISGKEKQNQIFKKCIKMLCQVSTKDFEYVYKFILLGEQQTVNGQIIEYIKAGMEQKRSSVQSSRVALIISTNRDSWKKNDNANEHIALDVQKNQNDLKKRIKDFMKNSTKNTLFIDFSRESAFESSNMNDASNYFEDKTQERIQISYILHLIEKCEIQLQKQNVKKNEQKIRLIVNYDRLNPEQFTPVSFLQKCDIFTLDGGSQSKKTFDDVNLKSILKKILKEKKFKLQDTTETEDLKKIHSSINLQISNNQVFQQCCKDYILEKLKNDISLADKDIIDALKDKSNLTKYKSILDALTEKQYKQKLEKPVNQYISIMCKSKSIINFAPKAKFKILSNSLGQEIVMQNEYNEMMENFLIGMIRLKKDQFRVNPHEQDQNEEGPPVANQVSFPMPTFFPFSQVQLNLLFSEEYKSKIQECKSITQLQAEYYKKLQNTFKNPELFRYYKLLTRENQYWKDKFLADVVTVLAEKAKIGSKYVFNFIKQLQLMKGQFFPKIVSILANFNFYGALLRIFNIFAENQITKTMKSAKSNQIANIAIELLNYCSQKLKLTVNNISALKTSEGFSKKLNIFAQMHHNVFFQLQNLANTEIIRANADQYLQICLQEEFLTIWEIINIKLPILDLQPCLEKFDGQKMFEKISIIKDLLFSILQQNKSDAQLSKPIYQYMANKLFPRWLQQCNNQNLITLVFQKFCQLCEKSLIFAHNCTSCISIGLKPLQLSLDNNNLDATIEKLKNFQPNTLNEKFMEKMGMYCQKNKFQDNLSVIICNIMFTKLRRFNSLLKDKSKGFTLIDLQSHLQRFKRLIIQIHQGKSPILKIFAFAFIRVYLSHYVDIAQAEKDICRQVDEILSQKNQLAENLRFYCMKLLRRKFNAKQISENFIKAGTFKWCQMFKSEMTESNSRAIQVPKIPQQIQIKELQKKIEQFLKFDGRDVNFLDEIVDIGSKSWQGRYIVFNFFMRYLYPMAYNKQYEKQIKDHVVSKKEQYETKLGKEEYQLLLRYAFSKFDDNYFVQSYEKFNQSNFVTLNNINWLLATKSAQSPFHSLFFNNGNLHPSIYTEINASFVPCGPENIYISIAAKAAEADTRNSNVGVYICGNSCDRIYTLLDCGWPAKQSDCEMCGMKMGGKGHKLTNIANGARRLISDKFILNSNFYISRFKNFQQYWQAQRCYIQAEVNRIRKKSEYILRQTLQNGNKKQEKSNLLGYNINFKVDKFSINRINSVTLSTIMLCLESNFYCLVSLDIIKPEECAHLFGSKQKKVALDNINKNIQEHIKNLKLVVDLNTKFYTWLFGIQAEIYQLLVRFPQEFDKFIINMENEAHAVVQKLKDKQPKFDVVQYKVLYDDLIRVIENGLTTKQFKEVQSSKEMSSRNQFTRHAFEQLVEKIVSSNLFENKLAFVQSKFTTQGKLQFPFDIMLTQSKYDPAYRFSKILKTPSQQLTFEQISSKYEIIIRDKFPVLDYLLNNMEPFSVLNSYYEIAKASNLFSDKISYKMTRPYSQQYSLNDFNKQFCGSEVNLPVFVKEWKRIANYLGPIQVGCKPYGTANNQLNDSSGIYNFLLDNIIKENANGKILVGIYHNFAVLHNQVLNNLKTRKNLITKYKNMNFFNSDLKINPQKIQREDCLLVEQEQITEQILQSSIPSIQYGDNMVYHNFDSCQARFLSKLKGKCQLESTIEQYVNIHKFVGQTFTDSTPNTNVNALGDVRDCVYMPLTEDIKKELSAECEDKNELQVFETMGLLEQLINQMSKHTQHLNALKQTSISEYINRHCTDNNQLQQLITYPQISDKPIYYAVPLYELVEQKLRPSIRRKIPEKYSMQIEEENVIELKKMLETLAKNTSDELPTIDQLRQAVENYVYRNLITGHCSESTKIFEIIAEKKDLWPFGVSQDKIYKLYEFSVIFNIKSVHAIQAMRLLQDFM